MSKYTRSRILVDPKVQWAIAGRILCHWVMFLVCLISIGAMVRVIAGAGNQPFGESFRAAMATQIPIIGVMLLLLPVFLRDTLKMSNRFAGPMYRLRTALRTVSESKECSPIKFRDGDFWHEAATDFNIVLGQLNTLKAENDALRAQLAKTPEEVNV